MLGYWLNHPSLSYLFSGLFIGPTSQHPRVDEARNDALHELEIAFRQSRLAGRRRPGWSIACSAICWSMPPAMRIAPSSASTSSSPRFGRRSRGLLELRAFEMPPHWRMSVAQQALLRGLVAKFWDRPYEKPLSRWGTRLHDDFMLPHFVWQDFNDVLSDSARQVTNSRRSGCAAFRVPLPEAGRSRAQRGLELELRHALEPWHVLGEEPGRRWHGALRRFDRRKAAGQGRRAERSAPCHRLQWLEAAAARYRHGR